MVLPNEIILDIMDKIYDPEIIKEFMKTNKMCESYVKTSGKYRVCDGKWYKCNRMKICMERYCENESLNGNEYCYYCCRKERLYRKPVQLYEIVCIVDKINIQMGSWSYEKKYITNDTFERLYTSRSVKKKDYEW